MGRSPSEEVSAPLWVELWEYLLHHGAPPPPTLVFPLLFLTPLFPRPLSLWCFLPFFTTKKELQSRQGYRKTAGISSAEIPGRPLTSSV